MNPVFLYDARYFENQILQNIIYRIYILMHMDKITSYKTVMKQGSSLVLMVTKELSHIGLMRGDRVKVTLERVDNDGN